MTNHETFTEIYKRYGALIMKSVTAQTKDKVLAEEICQQTFLNFYRSMESVDTNMVKAWLLQVSKNLLIDYWRKASTRKEVTVKDTTQALKDKTHPMDVEKNCTDRQFICQIMEDLKAENKLWYEVIDYVCIRGMSCEKAAKLLGTSPAGLRARLHRAKQFIRQKYGDEYLNN